MAKQKNDTQSREKAPKKKKQSKVSKQVKKTARRIRLILLLVIILAGILAYFIGYEYGLNLGSGDGKNPNSETSNEQHSQSDATKQLVETNSQTELVVRVTEDMIFLDDEVITLEDLEIELKGKKEDNISVILVDNISIETTFKSVEELLNKYEIPTVIVEDGNIE